MRTTSLIEEKRWINRVVRKLFKSKEKFINCLFRDIWWSNYIIRTLNFDTIIILSTPYLGHFVEH